MPSDSPTAWPGNPRGTLVAVTGTLADPYGQLEIRIATDGIRAIGTGTLPTPGDAGGSGLDEMVEGRMMTATGILTTKPKRSSGGDLTIILERPGAAPIKAIADASSGLGTDAFTVGATYRVVGVVGQRASRKGVLDGYRICLRDPADVIALAGLGLQGPASTTTGVATPGGATGPLGPGSASASVTRIAAALGLVDQQVAIEGVVTAPATLLDTTGRRIVVQDSSGAIELLLPIGVDAPAVGATIRADGRVGVAYGAPRLRTDQLTILGRGQAPAPVVLRGAPGLAVEWQLVTVSGRIESVRKLGDRWRAEVLVAAARVIVVGQAGSGIAASTLVEGRMATVTGIARRPNPNASDQRYVITPRFPADLRVIGMATAGSSGSSSGGTTAGAGAGAGTGTGVGGTSDATGPADVTGEPPPDGVPDADLVDLGLFVGQTVRVGGLIVDLRPGGLALDDGTAIGFVVLRGEALDLLALMEPDDAINVTGRVELGPDGLAVVADDPGGISQAGDPIPPAEARPADGVAGGSPGARAEAGPFESASPSIQSAGFLDGPPDPGAGIAGIGSLIAISMVSLIVSLSRRALARRRLDARIATRVAAIGASRDPASVPRSGERGGNPFHSA